MNVCKTNQTSVHFYFGAVFLNPDLSRKMERLAALLPVQGELILTNMENTFSYLLLFILNLMQIMYPQDPFPCSFPLFLEEVHPIYSYLSLEVWHKVRYCGKYWGQRRIIKKICAFLFFLRRNLISIVYDGSNKYVTFQLLFPWDNKAISCICRYWYITKNVLFIK